MTTAEVIVMEGGCACGAVRYRLTAQPRGVGYCHCRMCQKAAGAPVMVFGVLPMANFALLRGEPRCVRLSDLAERWFCGHCGSALAMVMTKTPDTLEISIPTLDTPERVAPEFHIWEESRLPWFTIADDLPHHARERDPAA